MPLDRLSTPQRAALCAIAGVVDLRLKEFEACPTRNAPLIVQLDGPGHSEMLGELHRRLGPAATKPCPIAPESSHAATTLDELTHFCGPVRPEGERFIVVEFDAWQHQRLAAPWWWLVDVIDRQIRHDMKPERRRSGNSSPEARRRWRRFQRRNARWHALHLLKALRIVAPFVFGAVVLWLLAGPSMREVLTSAASVTAAVSALMVAAIASIRPLRRGMLMSVPQPDKTVLRTGDPMAELRQRYAFLLQQIDTPMMVLIDHLDRCQASYVVELLEGLQTLLRHPRAEGTELPLVAFVVAADRDWLCSSFLQRYEGFESAADQPGRPFGQLFLEQIFDFELRLPTIPAAFSVSDVRAERVTDIESDAAAQCAKALSEAKVRAIVSDAELKASGSDRALPLQKLRIAAVDRLAQLEHGSKGEPVCPHAMQPQCNDTGKVLNRLVARLDAGAAVSSRLDTAYCVQRTTQLLGGHEIEKGEIAIARLGVWTILATRWPLLAEHLVAHPRDIECLRSDASPSTKDEGLVIVFADRDARQLASRSMLTTEDIKRFSVPVEAQERDRVNPSLERLAA